ncbi:MAG: hypothetical protein OEW39_03155 [Deltaproteobacteria bacterium]|nr:hypothetical protein [Deltaproteobacteria bacterium]
MLIFILAALVLLMCAMVVAFPLVFEQLETYGVEEADPDEFDERDALLDALSELEQDYKSGKLSKAVFETQQAHLQQGYLEELERQNASVRD